MGGLNELNDALKRPLKKGYLTPFHNLKRAPRSRFPSFNTTTEEGRSIPEAEQVQSIVRNADQLAEMESADGPLTVCPFRLDANPPDMRLVTAAAFALRKHGIALAVDQPNGIMFVDQGAIAKVTRKIRRMSTDLSPLDLSLLSHILVGKGLRVANIVVAIDLETLGFYQIFEKPRWRKLLKL